MIDYTNIFTGGILVIAIIFIAILIGLLVIYFIGTWKFFKKAGKNGWECLIPFYSQWIMVEIASLNWWWFLLLIANSVVTILDLEGLTLIASVANIIANIPIMYNYSKKLHKGTSFVVLGTIFPWIALTIAGFSSNYNWDNSISVSPNGPFGASPEQNNSQFNQSSSTAQMTKYCPTCGTKVENSNYCSNCGTKII